MDVLYFTKDLLFSSRVSSLAREAGRTIDVRSALKTHSTDRDTAIVIIDLGLPQFDIADAVRQLRQTVGNAQIIAYGPHVDAAMLAAAEQAGCDLVLPRSQFDQRIAAILRELPASNRSPES